MNKQVAIGSRVIAISHDDGPTFFIFGYGTFEGCFLPPYIDEAEAIKEILIGHDAAAKVIPSLPALSDEMVRTMILLDNANPRIKLDNGKVVWGYECWWISTEEFDNLPKPEGFKIVDVDIEEARERAKAAKALEEFETITPEQMIASFKDVN